MKAKRILIVDDNQVVVKALSNALTTNGYEVLTAQDGAGAVSTIRREQPDLVLLDISFPPDVAHGGGVAWDGFLIMNWVGRMQEAAHIPVIIITGAEATQFKARALAAGAVDYLQKPIEPDQLLEAVRRVLGEQHPAEGAVQACTPVASPTGT